MTTTDSTHPAAPGRTPPVAIARTGIVAAVAAAVAVTVVAAVGDAIDVPLVASDDEIPLGGFAAATVLWSIVGVVLAIALDRWTRRARTEFLAVTVVLVALSFVPVLNADAEAATKVLLALTHLVAAGIVIPAIGTRLHDR